MATLLVRYDESHAVAILEQRIVDNRLIVKRLGDIAPDTQVVEVYKVEPFAMPQTNLTLAASKDMPPEKLAKLARYIQKRIDNFGKLVASAVDKTENPKYFIYRLLTNFKNTGALYSFLYEMDDIKVLKREELSQEFFVGGNEEENE